MKRPTDESPPPAPQRSSDGIGDPARAARPLRVALFANDGFGGYVFDSVCAVPGIEIVCVVGETRSTRGRLARKWRRLVRRKQSLVSILRARFSAREAAPPVVARNVPSVRLHEICAARGLPFFEDHRLHSRRFVATLRRFDLDLILITTFGTLLADAVLAVPRRGVINCHFALLPRHRGRIPEIACLVEGARQTGVTVHLVDTGMDTGAILDQRVLAVEHDDDLATLQAKLYPLGRELVVDVLGRLVRGDVPSRAQDPAQATYCPKPAEFRRIDPASDSGERIHNVLRACLGTRFAPWLTEADGRRLYLLDAAFVPHARTRESEADASPALRRVACRDGTLVVRRAFLDGAELRA